MQRDEAKLWQEWQEKNNFKARDELILKYLPLVKYQADRLKMVVPSFIEKEDLESYGIIGLIEALAKFDYQKGIKFKTYAQKRIRGEIIDHLRQLDWLPHSLRRDCKRLQAKVTEIYNLTGKKPDIEELAQALELTPVKVENLYQKIYSSQWISIFAEAGEKQLLDVLVDDSEQQPGQVFFQEEKIELLAAAIAKLNQGEQLLISLYYQEELNQKEIAEVMDLSPARVSQIHKKAINRLRGSLSRKKALLI